MINQSMPINDYTLELHDEKEKARRRITKKTKKNNNEKETIEELRHTNIHSNNTDVY